jgi:hypothetical protein
VEVGFEAMTLMSEFKLSSHPNYFSAWSYRAYALIALGKPDLALAILPAETAPMPDGLNNGWQWRMLEVKLIRVSLQTRNSRAAAMQRWLAQMQELQGTQDEFARLYNRATLIASSWGELALAKRAYAGVQNSLHQSSRGAAQTALAKVNQCFVSGCNDYPKRLKRALDVYPRHSPEMRLLLSLREPKNSNLTKPIISGSDS